MIIVDFHQIMFANIMAQSYKTGTPDHFMVRHMILNALRNINKTHREEYGSMVIAVDTGPSWRRAVFPYYKANRRDHIEKTDFEWEEFFDTVNMVKSEILNVVPYKVISVETAEGDDIIGTLTYEFRHTRKILIISGDKDFIQLHNDNVQQFNPVQKKWVVSDVPPQRYLLEHILRGDAGDGIPNILSDDDTFINESKRQNPLRKSRIRNWGNMDLATDSDLKNFARNSVLIDLTCTPDIIKNEIMRIYEEDPINEIDALEEYLVNNNLKQLTQAIGDFL